jgi:hypothetical protein
MMAALAGSLGGQPSMPSQQSEVDAPQSCEAVKSARLDQQATIFGLFAPGTGPGPLGKEFIALSDKLSAAMTSDNPDMTVIGNFWRQMDRLKNTIGSTLLNRQTQCTLDKIGALPLPERKEFLRGMAPPRHDEARPKAVPPISRPPSSSELR